MEDDAFHDASTRFGEPCGIRDEKLSRLFAWPDPLFEARACDEPTASDALLSLDSRTLRPIGTSLVRRVSLTATNTVARANSDEARRPGAPTSREGRECVTNRGRLPPTPLTIVSSAPPVSRGVLAVSCFARRIRAAPPVVRTLAGDHERRRRQRLTKHDVRQTGRRGFCNSNGEYGHTPWGLPHLSYDAPGKQFVTHGSHDVHGRGRRPGAKLSTPFGKGLFAIPPLAKNEGLHRAAAPNLPRDRSFRFFPTGLETAESTTNMRFHTLVRRPKTTE